MKKMQIGSIPQMDAGMAEAFNRLRVNLGFCGDKAKTIMITSSVSEEGKTFVSVQLWKQLAEVGIPTLLVDCDLKKSQFCGKCNICDIKDIDGMTQYLSGQAKLEDVLYETDVPNGYFLPVTSFTERPDILLAGERFAHMIEECKRKFELVLIDAPSVGSLPDVMNIATHCDGTVFVVRSAFASSKVVRDCVQVLQYTGTPILGIVLNGFDVNNKSNSYYYQNRNQI